MNSGFAMPPALSRGETVVYGTILALGGLLMWLSEVYPAQMPYWAPWDFSPSFYLATALGLYWFLRGRAVAPVDERPHVLRTAAFLVGVALTYAALQTRYEYWSQHMFFLNRIQHVVMHHMGPLLIAAAWPWPAMRRGLPVPLQRAVDSRAVRLTLRVVQQPVLAAFLFVGLFFFWLIPSVHFRAMLDPQLYAIMNWTMVFDGILFWSLVLDPRPKPLARVTYGTRTALATSVIFPQIILGAAITFVHYDLYPYYDLCGRLFPAISAIDDQQIGGIIIWIPPAMMSVIAVLLVLNALRKHEDTIKETDDDASALAAFASRWTGRD